MQNPIVAIREKLGFDRRGFALALGVSYTILRTHENGLVVQHKKESSAKVSVS